MKNLLLLVVFLFPILLSGQKINEHRTLDLQQEMSARASALSEVLKTHRNPKKGVPFPNNVQSRNRASSCNLSPVPAYACQEVYNFNSDLADSIGVIRIENTFSGDVLEKQIDYAIDETTSEWTPTFRREQILNDSVNFQVLSSYDANNWIPATLVERRCGGEENVFLNALSDWDPAQEEWALNAALGIEVLYRLDTSWYIQDWTTPSTAFGNQNVDFKFEWLIESDEILNFDVNFEFQNNTEDSLSNIVFIVNQWDTLNNEWAVTLAKNYGLTKEELIFSEELLIYDGEEFNPFKFKSFIYDEADNLSQELFLQIGLTGVERGTVDYFYNERQLLDSTLTNDVALETLESTKSERKIFTYDEQSRLHSETLHLWQSDEEGWRISTRDIFEREDNVLDVIKKYFRFPSELEAFKLQEVIYSHYDPADCMPFFVNTQDIQLQKEFDIYPNPSIGLYGIYNNNVERTYDYQVLNTQGQILKQKTNCQGDQTFDLSSFSKGIYFLLISSEYSNFSKKLILN